MDASKRHYTREIAEWAAQLKYEDIPERIIEKAKLQTMSVLASIFASSRADAGHRLREAVRRWSDPGQCRMIPFGDSVTMKDVLTANSGMSMLMDYDDYLFAGHSGHSAVLAPLALAERMEVDGKQMLTAQVIANEVEARLGGSVMMGPLNGQMWAFIHSAGAALAAGKLMGLDAGQMTSALGMSLAQPAWPLAPGFLGGDSKLFTASAGIHTGVLAAQFAAEGLEGPEDIIETDEGFCDTFSFIPLYPMLTRLGECWLSDTLSYKLYPGCAYIDSTMDCVFKIRKEKKIDTDDIFKIDVYASLLTVKMDELATGMVRHQNTHPVTLNFYTPYNVAAGLIDGELGPDQFRQERIEDPKVWELAKRVRVHHDIALTGKVIDSVTDLIDLRFLLSELRLSSLRTLVKKIGPGSPLVWLAAGREVTNFITEGRRTLDKVFGGQREEKADKNLAKSAEDFKMAFGSRVVFEMKSDKKNYECEQEIPYGAAGRPLEELKLDVAAKFEKEARQVITGDASQAAMDKISDFENQDSAGVRALVSDCCSQSE
ncbi:MAG: MmgE/PrpD family protein, partial [bacterium]